MGSAGGFPLENVLEVRVLAPPLCKMTRNVDYMAKLIQVIETETTRGKGNPGGEVCRKVIQYWSVDGDLLAERDTYPQDGVHVCECPGSPYIMPNNICMSCRGRVSNG